jgi:hypothetical protein
MTKVDPHTLPYDDQIARLTREIDALRQKLATLESELDWWQQGRDLYGSDVSANGEVPDGTATVSAGAQTAAAGGKTTELVPGSDVLGSPGTKPTLAQAIVRVMADGPRKRWTATQVMADLRANDWMPKGTSAEHQVRTKLAHLARGQNRTLRRVEHGVYALSKSGSAALVPAEGP